MLYTVSHLTFACYSAVCRPPGKNGGTGGSLKGGAHDAPISPASRKAMRALKKEADALAEESNLVLTDDEIAALEPRVTAFGQKVYTALEKVLADDAELSAAVKRASDARKLIDDADAAYTKTLERRQEIFTNSMGRDYTAEERSEYDKLGQQLTAFDQKIRGARRGLEGLNRAVVERRASVIGQALNEIVPMGGKVAGIGAHKPRKDRFGKVGLTVNEVMTMTAKVYPKSWIDASNDFATGPHDANQYTTNADEAYLIRPLVFRKSQSRAHYDAGRPVTNTVRDQHRPELVELPENTVLTITKYKKDGWSTEQAKSVYARIGPRYDEITLDEDIGTGVHEYAHRMEYMLPTVARLERKFIERRAGTKQSVPMGKGYDKDEFYLPDSLFHKYAEKVYDSGANEVMSMGWEYYVTGKTSSNRTPGARPDSEHMGLILGALTTVRTTTKPRKFTLR